jgi:hypothetical protein
MKKYLTLKNLGWLITAVVVFMLGMSGFGKVAQTEEMVANLTFFNVLPHITWIGALELASVALLVYPKTSIFGALGISAAMSGAVALHFSYLGGVGIFMPILLGILAWSAHCLRTYKIKA